MVAFFAQKRFFLWWFVLVSAPETGTGKSKKNRVDRHAKRAEIVSHVREDSQKSAQNAAPLLSSKLAYQLKLFTKNIAGLTWLYLVAVVRNPAQNKANINCND